MQNDLIFDLGFHIGQDTEFYLKKGFRVVAIEANPELCLSGNEKFKYYIENSKLVLINKAIANSSDLIKFFIHPTHKDWSSCFKDFIMTENELLTEIEVHGVTVSELFEAYGIPRYMKVDIEGADALVAQQLSRLKNKPAFVSFETSRRDFAKIFTYLYLAGYSSFQLVNQLKYDGLQMNNINKEGVNLDYKFEFGSYGIFGKDLPEKQWITYEELLLRYTRYIELRNMDQENLAMGWLDVHARLEGIM